MKNRKIKKIHKEINVWKRKNALIENNKLFEDLDTGDDSKELYNLFKDFQNLKMTFIASIFSQYDAMFRIKLNKPKKILSKLSGKNFDDYFYYFLIFNYENVAVNEQIFKIHDYSFIYKNRFFLKNQQSK
ncbi:MAG0920 family protein [Metamycoplasma phocicerebrale]|uniref:MAG0920 family protein n=1 Tax=Metamycoplasma phocicerebrale TaxID=142649 RepID=UPI003BB21F21